MKISFDVNALKTNQQKNDFFHIKKFFSVLFILAYSKIKKNEKNNKT